MFQKIKTLDDIKVNGKLVLVRVDFNSDIRNGKLIPSERLTAPLITVRELQNKKARVVLIAHQGRPGSKDFTNLKQHAQFLKKHIKMHFVEDVLGSKVIKAVVELKDSEIILLDNIRFIEDELKYDEKKPNKLVNILAPLFDYYVNDAFSVSHRAHASIVGFPKVLESAMGRTFERELKSITKLNVKDALLVLGGSKPEDNVQLAEAKSNRVLASGLFGPFCLMANGIKLGKQNKIMRDQLKAIGLKTKKILNKITVPIDLAIEKNGKRIDLKIEEFPQNKEIQDLGKKTIELYEQKIISAKALLFKGLVGLCNNKEFSQGTSRLLHAAAKCKGFTVISGGHTLTMIDKLKIPKSKFGYVSLSGGALIDYLAKGTLPGIKSLELSRNH